MEERESKDEGYRNLISENYKGGRESLKLSRPLFGIKKTPLFKPLPLRGIFLMSF